MPLLGKYRFRVELHAKGRLMAMCKGHDLTFLRTCCYGEMRCAQVIALNNKRMVATDAKWGRKSQ
ncbi:hypothetical protein ACVWXM_009908 [Bradyrhizobium sp. GM7.3]